MDATNNPDVAEQPLDLKKYLRLFWRRKWLILAVWALVAGATTLYSVRQPKVFSASTSVIIDVTAPRFLDSAQLKDVNDYGYSNYWANKEYYETQHRIVTSRAVSARVVEKLRLDRDAEFLGVSQIQDPAARTEAMKAIDAAALLQARIKVVPIKDSRIVNILIEDGEAKRAALLANEVASAYIAEDMALRARNTENAFERLEERRAELEEKSKRSELQLYELRRTGDMLATTLEDRLNSVTSELAKQSEKLTEVNLRIAALKARVEAIRGLQKVSGTNDERWAEGLNSVSGNPLITEYKLRFASQKVECAELKDRYLEKHPKVMACQEKLAATQGDLLRELGNIIRGAETDLREAEGERANLAVLVAESKTKATEFDKRRLDYERLKRETDNDQRLYDMVLRRLKDIELSAPLLTSNVRVLDPARPILAPIRPKVQQTVTLALLVGLLAGIGLVLLLELIDSSVTSQNDIEEKMGLPYLGFVPTTFQENGELSEDSLYIYRQPQSPASEACRAVRTNLLFMSPDDPARTLLVTSSGPQEGKSATVINLGITMAQSGNRVVVVDTDMRRPRLHRAFGVPNDKGVSSVLVGEGKLDEALKSTEVPGLFLLPCGPVPPNPAELLHTQAFEKLLATLQDRFDRVILDSPPVGAVADAAVLATKVAGVVVVLRAGKTLRDVAKRAVRSLVGVNARIFGAVLNAVDLTDTKYDYAYQKYGYYYREGKNEGAS